MAETFEATLAQVLNTDPVAPPAQSGFATGSGDRLPQVPGERPGPALLDGQELAEELDRFLKGEPIYARPIGLVGKGWRWCRRKPAMAGMAVHGARCGPGRVSGCTVARSKAREQETLERYAANISLADESICQWVPIWDLSASWMSGAVPAWEMGRLLFQRCRKSPPFQRIRLSAVVAEAID